jgi:hypothetical protein
METIINRNDLHLLKLLRPHARLRDKLARLRPFRRRRYQRTSLR